MSGIRESIVGHAVSKNLFWDLGPRSQDIYLCGKSGGFQSKSAMLSIWRSQLIGLCRCCMLFMSKEGSTDIVQWRVTFQINVQLLQARRAVSLSSRLLLSVSSYSHWQPRESCQFFPVDDIWVVLDKICPRFGWITNWDFTDDLDELVGSLKVWSCWRRTLVWCMILVWRVRLGRGWLAWPHWWIHNNAGWDAEGPRWRGEMKIKPI